MWNHTQKILLIFLIAFTSCDSDDNSIIIPEEVEISENIEVYNPESFFKGYTLFTPVTSNNTYLVNMEGFIVKKWESQHRGLAVYLSESGDLYRTYVLPNSAFSFGGRTGGIEKFDFNGNLIWDWQYSTDEYSLHHDLSILPNGNILASVWDKKTRDEAISNGRNPELLTNDEVWPDRIIEIQPVGSNNANIVWEWSVWDHIIQDFDSTKDNFGNVAEHPELFDINYTIGDANFNHVNSLFYIEEFDQIVFSSRRFNELMIIDHSTTTTEAASNTGGFYNKGGNLLYRWGNPITYKSGLVEDQKLFGQHDVTYLGNLPTNGNSNFMIFNNARFETMSSVDEISIPQNSDGSYNLQGSTNNLPIDYAWSYHNPEIFAPRVSGAQRLENGNTLISFGTEGTLYEIDDSSVIVWKYKVPLEVNDVFKTQRYSTDFSGFGGIELPLLEDQTID